MADEEDPIKRLMAIASGAKPPPADLVLFRRERHPEEQGAEAMPTQKLTPEQRLDAIAHPPQKVIAFRKRSKRAAR